MKVEEATARIKINWLREEAGWRFSDDASGPANIVLELNTKIAESQINALGEDFQTTKYGFIDFLLLGSDGRPLIVLEVKSEGKNPLAAKGQAWRYARERNAPLRAPVQWQQLLSVGSEVGQPERLHQVSLF